MAKELNMQYIPMEKQIANKLTKPFLATCFEILKDKLTMVQSIWKSSKKDFSILV